MKFQVTAKVEKEVWKNDQSFLYNVQELNTNRTKHWSFWTVEPLTIGESYDFTGTVSESKDKKVKDQNGRDIWRPTFNVDLVKPLDNGIPF